MFSIAFFVEKKLNNSYLKNLQNSVNHFHKIATFFTTQTYQNEQEIEQNLNRLRNIVFWNTSDFSHNPFSFPLVVTKTGINIEDKTFVPADLSKNKSIQGKKLILRYPFSQDSYFLLIPLTIPKDMSLKVNQNGQLKVSCLPHLFVLRYLWFLFIMIVMVVFILSKTKRHFERKGRRTFLSLYRKTRRTIGMLEKQNKEFQSKVYCIQTSTSYLKNKVFESAKDYLAVSEKSIELFREFYKSQSDLDVFKNQQFDYLMVCDVFRKESFKLSYVFENVLKILGDIVSEKDIKIFIEPFVGRSCFYGDKEVIFSSLYLILQTVFYSKTTNKEPIKITGDIKNGYLIVSFLGVSLSLKDLSRHSYSHLFCVKKGAGSTFRIVFEPFFEHKKKSKKLSTYQNVGENVVVLFKKN